MNPVLLLPAGLAALAALALPLLVHLSRRQQQRPTVFAALRWLQARPRPRRRLRFDERWLLAVRLLLVALLALLLAQPALRDVADARPRLLVVPGVDAEAIAAAQASGDPDARWLAPGFPPLETQPPAGRFATASLLREFEASLPARAPLTVLVPERLEGMDAARLQLVRAVDWRIAPGGELREPADIPAPALAVRHDAAHRDGVRYLRAAALAWQDGDVTPPEVEESTQLPPHEGRVLAWMHAGPLPAALLQQVEQGARVLVPDDAVLPDGIATAVAWRDGAGAPLLQAARLGDGRLLQFTRALAPAAMPQLLSAEFPHALRERLQPVPAPGVVAAADHAPETGGVAMARTALDLRPWLAVAIALLALLERWLATSRRRGAAA